MKRVVPFRSRYRETKASALDGCLDPAQLSLRATTSFFRACGWLMEQMSIFGTEDHYETNGSALLYIYSP
ncbi:MAG: hypothetical protein ACFFDI_24905 [Promethearchaeota archaeon]